MLQTIALVQGEPHFQLCPQDNEEISHAQTPEGPYKTLAQDIQCAFEETADVSNPYFKDFFQSGIPKFKNFRTFVICSSSS